MMDEQGFMYTNLMSTKDVIAIGNHLTLVLYHSGANVPTVENAALSVDRNAAVHADVLRFGASSHITRSCSYLQGGDISECRYQWSSASSRGDNCKCDE